MANKLQKLFYFVTAEVPAMFMIAIVWIIKESKWNAPYSISWKVPLLLTLIGIVMILLFYWWFMKSQKFLPLIDIKVTNYKSDDGWLAAYVLSYLVPLTSLSAVEYIFPALVVALAILLVVLTFSDYITPHPLLFIFGYHFYEIDGAGAASGYKLISKRRLRNADNDIKKVSRVFEFLLIRRG